VLLTAVEFPSGVWFCWIWPFGWKISILLQALAYAIPQSSVSAARASMAVRSAVCMSSMTL
jgi:hypothetical protein